MIHNEDIQMFMFCTCSEDYCILQNNLQPFLVINILEIGSNKQPNQPTINRLQVLTNVIRLNIFLILLSMLLPTTIGWRHLWSTVKRAMGFYKIKSIHTLCKISGMYFTEGVLFQMGQPLSNAIRIYHINCAFPP